MPARRMTTRDSLMGGRCPKPASAGQRIDKEIPGFFSGAEAAH